MVDGSFSFEGGSDSSRIPTIQSKLTINGLPRNKVAWGGNVTFRGGGINPRNGWKPLVDINAALIAAQAIGATGTFQGGWLYNSGFNNPYFILSIGGRIYKVTVDVTPVVTDLSAQFTLINPAAPAQAYFCQAEEFLVIQAGDYDVQFKTRPTPPPQTQYTTSLSGWNVPYSPSANDVTLNAMYGGAVGDIVVFGGGGVSYWTFTVIGISGTTLTVGNGIYLLGNNNPTPATGAYTVQKYASTPANPAATLPLFWDGTDLRRSIGIVTITPLQQSGQNEIPAATSMDYYMGRLWYAQGTTISAGDIVGGPSGTAKYNLRDSLLNVTENPLCFGGDGFNLPSTTGNIRAIFHTSDLNEPLGQGKLYIGTLKTIYRLQVPVTRSDWIAATANNQPQITITQGRGGVYGERCIVRENSDVFYRGLVGFYSISMAVQNFGQWGNTPISNSVSRIFQFEDRSLLRFTSGVSFDNRLLETVLPVQTDGGVAFQGIAPLDFDLITSLGSTLPPAWEGILQGLPIMQLFQGEFGGLSRAFAVIYSTQKTFQVWEITTDDRFDDEGNTDKRIEWYFESPAFTWNKETEMKRLDGAEIWFDRIFGTVDVTVEYRPDADSCWQPWFKTQFCSARSSCETLANPVCYPTQPYGENFKFPIVLNKPPAPPTNTMNQRPVDIGYQFQVRITVKGWARCRGFVLFALPFEKQPYGGISGQMSF